MLWKICGSTPVMWSVPFFGEESGGQIKLRVAVELPAWQMEPVRFCLRDNAKEAPDGWLISLHRLKRIGQAMRSDARPETGYAWHPKRMQNNNYQPHSASARGAFLDALFQKGVGASRDEIEYWWKTLCDHALDWLINKEEVVDMYFAQLQPIVWSGDWVWRVRAHKTAKSAMASLKRSHKLIAMDRQTVRRRISIIHTRAWKKIVRRVELERLAMVGRQEYAQTISSAVDRTRIYVGKECAERMEDRMAPSGRLRKGGGYRGVVLASCRNPIERSTEADRLRIQLARARSAELKESKRAVLREAKRKMRELQLMERSEQNVRDSRAILLQPGQPREKRPTGLLVRYRRGEPVSKELLALLEDGW